MNYLMGTFVIESGTIICNGTIIETFSLMNGPFQSLLQIIVIYYIYHLNMMSAVITIPHSLSQFLGRKRLNTRQEVVRSPWQHDLYGVVARSSRRDALLMSMGILLGVDASYGASSSGKTIPREQLVGSEIPEKIATVFDRYISRIQYKIGTGFNARIVIYGVTSRMPFGAPGDPSRQYGKDRKSCGRFHPPGIEGSEPYDVCSTSSPVGATCCRHYAYCVPYDRFPAFPGDSFSSVVLSSRVPNLPMDTIEGILAHELGHAIDFHIFGKRYRLQNRACDFVSEDVDISLSQIDSSVADPEYRADLFANTVVLPPGEALCYSKSNLLQTIITDKATNCSDFPGLMKHYSHEPLQGMRRVVI